MELVKETLSRESVHDETDEGEIGNGSLGLDLLACRGDCRGVFDRACREDEQGGGQEKDNERKGK